MRLYIVTVVAGSIILIASMIYSIICNQNKDFLEKGMTDSIKGIASLGIFYSHIATMCLTLNTSIVLHYSYVFLSTLGALGVGLFFMLSGYGMFMSLEKQGGGYKGKNKLDFEAYCKNNSHFFALLCIKHIMFILFYRQKYNLFKRCK